MYLSLYLLTIKAAFRDGERQEGFVGVIVGTEDKNARIKTVRPAWVGGGWEFFSVEQLIAGLQHEGVRVQEDALVEVGETPAVQFGEGDAQVGTREQRQVHSVLRVQNVHKVHLIENCLQLIPFEELLFLVSRENKIPLLV